MKIMFLCTGNSCRSQMAEGFARHHKLEACSAGLEPSMVNPLAIKVMAEKGIDISNHRSKPIDFELLKQMDLVVTVCSNADTRCPMIPPGIPKEHWPFDDPPYLTRHLSEAEALPVYRRVRDEIETAIETLAQRPQYA